MNSKSFHASSSYLCIHMYFNGLCMLILILLEEYTIRLKLTKQISNDSLETTLHSGIPQSYWLFRWKPCSDILTWFCIEYLLFACSVWSAWVNDVEGHLPECDYSRKVPIFFNILVVYTSFLGSTTDWCQIAVGWGITFISIKQCLYLGLVNSDQVV